MFSSFQDRVFRQVNSDFAGRLQNRAWRRLIVTLAIASSILVGAAIESAGDRMFWVIPAALPYYASVFLLNLSLRGIFELDDAHLDEHQIGTRNAAYKTAFGWTIVFFVLVVTAATVFDLDRAGSVAVAAFAFLTSILAPRLITAWTLDDDHDGD